jgi:hypothetical protein
MNNESLQKDFHSSPSIDAILGPLDVPPPFLFNGLKHHKMILEHLISKIREGAISDGEILGLLKKTGNSTADFYYGLLTPADVVIEIENKLHLMDLLQFAPFKRYLDSVKGKFLNIQLSDLSTWTLILGREPSRFIHFHPARGSLLTIRIRAITLRTAIFLQGKSRHFSGSDLTESVNHIRTEFLGESPVKDYSNTKGLRKLLEILHNHAD